MTHSLFVNWGTEEVFLRVVHVRTSYEHVPRCSFSRGVAATQRMRHRRRRTARSVLSWEDPILLHETQKDTEHLRRPINWQRNQWIAKKKRKGSAKAQEANRILRYIFGFRCGQRLNDLLVWRLVCRHNISIYHIFLSWSSSKIRGIADFLVLRNKDPVN